ncbi:MAG: hypothetical protein PF689_01355, partial [Deltaproteobacteria bacterium]|nr:hypothetical protein [Deltaproteobacteria bacterium]
MKNIKKNNITSKIALMGFVQIIVPTAVLILLLSIAFLKLKNVNKKYEDIVQGLHKDVNEIDKNLTRYNSTLRKNKNKIHNVNKKFGLAQLKVQMKYSSLELLLRLSEAYKSKINISSQELYKLYLKNQTLQNKPHSFAKNKNAEKQDADKQPQIKAPDSENIRESTEEKQIKDFKNKLVYTM